MQEEEFGVGACDEAGYVVVEELVNDLEIPIMECQRLCFPGSDSFFSIQ